MKYCEYLKLFNNNNFREIDLQPDHEKFYLLRSISKSATLKKFCCENKVTNNLNDIFSDISINIDVLTKFIRNNFKPDENIEKIESELNKMQNFDWGGSFGNSLEKKYCK